MKFQGPAWRKQSAESHDTAGLVNRGSCIISPVTWTAQQGSLPVMAWSQYPPKLRGTSNVQNQNKQTNSLPKIKGLERRTNQPSKIKTKKDPFHFTAQLLVELLLHQINVVPHFQTFSLPGQLFKHISGVEVVMSTNIKNGICRVREE